MRLSVLFAAALALVPAASAHARLFRQTYGATVPTADGCAWNINQDYFVPRHCDSCRYDLFSACKTGHTRSPACRHLHPVHEGYCTPYGACRYRWRDHVYKKYCGCTPLRHTYGPWKLEKCRKHGGCTADGCAGVSCDFAADEFATCEECAAYGWPPNLESMELETLGSLETVPTVGPTVMPTSASAVGPSSAQMAAPDPLPLGILPPAGALMSLPGAVN
jgi:hypothetical protein